jgi:hypothetical protein
MLRFLPSISSVDLEDDISAIDCTMNNCKHPLFSYVSKGDILFQYSCSKPGVQERNYLAPCDCYITNDFHLQTLSFGNKIIGIKELKTPAKLLEKLVDYVSLEIEKEQSKKYWHEQAKSRIVSDLDTQLQKFFHNFDLDFQIYMPYFLESKIVENGFVHVDIVILKEELLEILKITPRSNIPIKQNWDDWEPPI